jgi:uncharacterized protein
MMCEIRSMDGMLIAADIVVAILLLAGLACSLFPFLPGTPLILLAALVYAFATGFGSIGGGRLAILAGLTILAHILDYIAWVVGTKKFGGSGWAVAGALIGGMVGFFFGPFGVLLGPILGATAGELLKKGELGHSLKAGFGTLIGMLLGAVARFTLAVTMVCLFLWWLWRS